MQRAGMLFDGSFVSPEASEQRSGTMRRSPDGSSCYPDKTMYVGERILLKRREEASLKAWRVCGDINVSLVLFV